MAKVSINQLNEIVANGGGVSIDASSCTSEQLKALAAYAAESGYKPTVRVFNASKLKFEDLREIGAYGKGSVLFEF